MKKYTVANSFHNTRAQTTYSAEARGNVDLKIHSGKATKAEIQAQHRVWKALCGIKGCTCCDSWGAR